MIKIFEEFDDSQLLSKLSDKIFDLFKEINPNIIVLSKGSVKTDNSCDFCDRTNDPSPVYHIFSLSIIEYGTLEIDWEINHRFYDSCVRNIADFISSILRVKLDHPHLRRYIIGDRKKLLNRLNKTEYDKFISKKRFGLL